MSNYYVKTIERAAVPRSKRLREAGGYHSGGTSSPGGEYLPLTGGTITGDLRVRGNFIVGDVVIAMDADGRLHISKGLVSDGDLAAFGAEEGEEGGSGGLDIARLWEELAAEDSSKVIDMSHIPGALSGKADLQHTHAISEVTGLQSTLNSKWEWNASQVAGVKVNSAVAADRLASPAYINGTPFNGESGIITARWGSSRTITVWDFYNVNKQAAQGIDGSADFALKLPQSIKVKALNIDGVTLSVVGGRLHVDSTLTADGDLVAYGDAEGSSGGGLDEEAMWKALGGSMENKKISALYLPSLSSLSGNLDSSRITGLDSALTSYAKKDGSNATGTWPISISGNAASADISNYLYLNPNNGSHAAQNDAVPANGRFAIYDVNNSATAGGGDGYIMAFRWPSGNYVSQIYVDVDSTGIMALRHRSSSNVWSEWYRILHSGNIGSYALTPSNYTSTLDSRYVKKAGDTMTGILELDRAGESIIRYWISGVKKGATGYLNGTGAYLYSWPASKYLNITDAGSLLFGGSTVWHSGNDGSDSGLDADLLDGLHSSSFASATNFLTNSGSTTGYYKILINSTSPWMLYFRIRLYQSYDYYDIDISGYNYHSSETNYSWFSPKARLVSSNVSSINVYFGHDSANKLWVAVPARQYTGLAIYDITNGYSETSRFNAFTITRVSSLSGTTDQTQTCYRGASINDNVASATKLQTSRSLWGQSFNGTGNVSGAISSTGNITPSAAGSYNIGTASLWYERIYGRYFDTASGYNLRLCTGGVERLSINSSSGYVGIGTTSPAYKLDVAGEIRATQGITIGGTDDYGWYIHNSRIVAGIGTARGVNVGSLLVSSAWADYTKVPTNGIYSKGDIWTDGQLYLVRNGVTSRITSENSSWLHFYTNAPEGFYFDTDVSVRGDFKMYDSNGRLFIPSSEGSNKYYIRIE